MELNSVYSSDVIGLRFIIYLITVYSSDVSGVRVII